MNSLVVQNPNQPSSDININQLTANQAIGRLIDMNGQQLQVPAKCPRYTDTKENIMLYLLLRWTKKDWENLENFGFWKERVNEDNKDFFLMRAIADKILYGRDTTFDKDNILSSRFEYQTLYNYTLHRILWETSLLVKKQVLDTLQS